MATPKYQLTPFALGSRREMWFITWPLMLSLFSSCFMLFVDRLFLANYSLGSLSASANGSLAAYIFLLAPLSITGMSEVFVGRLHGGNDSQKIGPAIWQMLWISGLFIPFFMIVSQVIPSLLFRGDYRLEETIYFSTLLKGGVFFLTVPALVGFFSGQGKTRTIALTTLLANIFNILLDYLLIYGKWGFKKRGIGGAAIATVTSQVIQTLLLMALFFLSKEDVKKFSWRPDLAKIWEAIRLGLPIGLAQSSFMVVHLLFFKMMETAGPDFHTIAVLMQSVYLLLNFVGKGFCKGVSAIISNFLGAKEYSLINKSLISACQIHVLFSSLSFSQS